MGEDQIRAELAEAAVESVFRDSPNNDDRILYIGDTDQLIDAVTEYCTHHGCPRPSGLAVVINSERLDELRKKYADLDTQFLDLDFLTANLGEFDYVLANPPNLNRQKIDDERVSEYEGRFLSARGNFDVSSLFLEQALDHLAEQGRLSCILSSRFLSVESDRSLRQLLTSEYLVSEVYQFEPTSDQFSSPLILTVTDDFEQPTPKETTVKRVSKRNQMSEHTVKLPADGSSWSQAIQGVDPPVDSNTTLDDVSQRIGAGVATGADDVFIMKEAEVPPQLKEWVHPVIGGRELAAYDAVETDRVVICPYTSEGRLVSEGELGSDFQTWIELHRNQLEKRSSLARGDPVYAWVRHPPLKDILQPKILTRDFADKIKFWADESGEIIPRRSTYYIVPEPHVDFDELVDYLNSPDVRKWIEAVCRKMGSRGYRVNTRDLTEVPVPDAFAEKR